jgi:hypothetical protein
MSVKVFAVIAILAFIGYSLYLDWKWSKKYKSDKGDA